MVSFEEFKKLDLRVGKIIEVQRIEGSEKLVKLRVDLGSEERQIIAGIGKQYAPEVLIGKAIVVLVNLEPKTFMGFESQGMLLAADVEGKPILLLPDQEVPPGCMVR